MLNSSMKHVLLFDRVFSDQMNSPENSLVGSESAFIPSSQEFCHKFLKLSTEMPDSGEIFILLFFFDFTIVRNFL